MLYNSFSLFYLKNSINFLLYKNIYFFCCALFFLRPTLFLRLAPRPQARPMRLGCA
ncbi:hypothetical protein HanIR_Chr15g0769251 [Helianthus annuus]|nr:hypothetical protein HanIR_Chr15g0769251 [Helianthus annuus]